MRASEWIQAGFAVILAAAGLLWPLPAQRRWALALLAAFAVTLIALARLAAYLFDPGLTSVIRDWLPVVLTLVPYWQTGQFFLEPSESAQNWLLESDRALLRIMPRVPWAQTHQARLTMEWAYMACYPLVPLGLGVLYIAGLRRQADMYWFFVLVPTYLCYAITPFVPALPPRSIGAAPLQPVTNKSRVFNLWLLKHGSIQAISFPSAHVASALAISLLLLQLLPLAGFIFLAVSFWIAIAAVVGGYHYAIDVVLGAVVTLLVFAAWFGHLIPSSLFTAAAVAFATPL